MSDELTPDELAELKARYAKLYTHPIARLIVDHERLLARRDAAYRAGVEQAAKVCEMRAKQWDAQQFGALIGTVMLPKHLATEAEACCDAIRALAAPVEP